MSDDVFGDKAETPLTVNDLVGEGKKFKTVDELAKGKAAADAHIERLEREAQEHRTQAEAQLRALKEEIDAVKKSQRPPEPAKEQAPAPQLSADDIRNLVVKAVTDVEANRTTVQNQTEANAQMVKHFGSFDKAKEAMDRRMQELGIGVDDLKGIAKKSPSAFMELMTGTRLVEKPLSGSFQENSYQRQEKPVGNDPAPDTREYFEAMRKKDPRGFYSSAVQTRMQEAVKKGTYIIPGFNG